MAEQADLYAVLKRSRIFSSLEERDLLPLLRDLPRRSLAAGQVLYSQGDYGEEMALLMEGKLSVRVRRADGAESQIADLGPGAVVGEMSCIDPALRSATVIATAPSEVLELSRVGLKRLRETLPGVSSALVGGIIKAVTRRLRETDQRIQTELERLAGGTHLHVAVERAEGSTPGRPLPAGQNIDRASMPFFEGLAEADLDVLITAAPPLTWSAGAVLCQEGTPGISCFIVLSGQVEVVKEVLGAPVALVGLGPGNLVGQMSLVDRAPRSATVRCRTDVIALELARDVFERLLHAASPLALRFQERIAVAGIRQLRMADGQLARLMGAHSVQDLPPLAPDANTTQRLIYVQTALAEWTLPLDELDEITELEEIAEPFDIGYLDAEDLIEDTDPH